MKESVADGLLVAATCRVLNFSRQPSHRWLVSLATATKPAHTYRAKALSNGRRGDIEFDHRFLIDEPKAAGDLMCEHSAWRICRDNRRWSVVGKKRGKSGKKPGPPVHDDLGQRDFTVDAQTQLWLTDITEHKTAARTTPRAIRDVLSERTVVFQIDSRMNSQLTVQALQNAVARLREVASCIVRPHRRSQGGYNRVRKCVHAMSQHGLLGTIGDVGATGDNAAIEHSFALLLQERPRPASPGRPVISSGS